NLTNTVVERGAQVESLIRSLLTTGAIVSVEHVGVEALYGLVGKNFDRTAVLNFRSLLREPNSSYVGVVTISDYLKFIQNDRGDLRDDLFDSNVRDYEGDNDVNSSIMSTLTSNASNDFWWLNN